MYPSKLSTTKKKPKVVIDTNVIVSASILVNVEELGIPVRHRFYDESIQLFSIFKKRPIEKIGIATPKVRSEAFVVLTNAVKDVFIENMSVTDLKIKEIFFNNAVAFLNLCEHKMRSLFALLEQPNVHPAYFKINLGLVKQMSYYIRDSLWKNRYSRRYQREKEVEVRSKPITTEPHWKDDQKEEVVSTHSEQVYREAKQLEKFMRNFPNKNDEKILAEAITIKYRYPNHKFYIASCDTGFFSPLRIEGGVKSDTVTKEIESRFQITCDFPREIFFLIDESDIQNTGVSGVQGNNLTP